MVFKEKKLYFLKFLGFYLSPNTIKSIVDHYCVPFYSVSTLTPLLKANVDAHNNSITLNQQQNNEFDANCESLNNFEVEADKRFKITFQQYVKCCAKLKALSDVFHDRDLDQNRKATGSCSFDYEEVWRKIYFFFFI